MNLSDMNSRISANKKNSWQACCQQAVCWLVLLGAIGLISGCSISRKIRKANALFAKGDSIYFASLHYNVNTSTNSLDIAESYLKRALRVYPNHTGSLNDLGLICYSKGQNEKAIDFFNQAIKTDSNFSYAYNNKGMAYHRLGKKDQAEQNYLMAIRKAKSDPDVYYNLGILYEDWGLYIKAIAAYDEAIRLRPNYSLAFNNRGVAKSKARKNEEAVADFSKALELDSNYKEAWNGRGLAKYYLGQYESAISDFEQALKHSEYKFKLFIDAYSYNNMGNCYFALNNQEMACHFWKKAIESGYNYQPKWKEVFLIEDPRELLKKYCE